MAAEIKKDTVAPPVLRSRSAPIIERAPLPIVEVQGSEHLVSHVNSAFCRLLGKTSEELIGKSFAEIVEGGKGCVPLLDRVYQTGEGLTHVQRAGSEPAHWLYAMWPALDANERPAGVIIQLTKAADFRQDAVAVNEALLIAGLRQHEFADVAEKLNVQLRMEVVEHKKTEVALGEAICDLKSAQAATERASRAKDNFLAVLSHELRTPLTPVLLAAAALREDERLPADARKQLGMIERNIALEARLIDDLLDVTAISHGKLQLRTQPCDAHSLINLAVEIVREDARAKEISIERSFAAQCSGLIADPARFQQVIWNLLRNALKFTPRGGKISIGTRGDKTSGGATWLHIEITDSGIGIAPELLEHIFLPFNQGSLTGVHGFGGVGLGLAIARAVVDLHGGRISAQSAGLNCGATFLVELPCAGVPASGIAEIVSQPPAGAAIMEVPPAFVPLRLLVVEDHESTLQALCRLLENDGHRVVPAATVAEALTAATANKFDFVISDLGLPDGTGTELMEQLRAAYGLSGIALSGYGMDEDLVSSRKAGFVTHLVKPVSIAELRRVIASRARSPIEANCVG